MRLFKKTISILLALLIVTGLFTAFPFAASAETDGDENDIDFVEIVVPANVVDTLYYPGITAGSVNDGNLFGLPSSLVYKKATLLGAQQKSSEDSNDLRFVAEISSDYFSNPNVDYGFEIVKTSKTNTAEFESAGGFDIMQNLIDTHSANIVKASYKGTTNNIVSGGYGDNSVNTRYKYVTMSIKNIEANQGAAVRFYVTIGGTTYYAGYQNSAGNDFRGCCASYENIIDEDDSEYNDEFN